MRAQYAGCSVCQTPKRPADLIDSPYYPSNHFKCTSQEEALERSAALEGRVATLEGIAASLRQDLKVSKEDVES